MTEQDKQLLLKDICGRLPYGVNFKQSDSSTIKMRSVGFETKNVIPINLFFKKPDFYLFDNFGNLVLKPYLRPMSSMTDEEETQVHRFMDIVTNENYGDGYSPSAWDAMNDFVQYCDSHHLDHRGLIFRGLALEAPEGMYNTKTE